MVLLINLKEVQMNFTGEAVDNFNHAYHPIIKNGQYKGYVA